MYRITFPSRNRRLIYDAFDDYEGTFDFYTDDIEDFQKRWLALEREDDIKEKFLRAKAGEQISDPRRQVAIQYDDASVLAEKKYIVENITFDVYDGYGRVLGRSTDNSSKFHVDKWNIIFKWICFNNHYYRIASYTAKGVCFYCKITDKWITVECKGNPVIENIVKYDFRYKDFYMVEDTGEWFAPEFSAFAGNSLETVCFIESKYFNSEQKVKEDIDQFEVNEEIMSDLFWDVVG